MKYVFRETEDYCLVVARDDSKSSGRKEYTEWVVVITKATGEAITFDNLADATTYIEDDSKEGE
jgi:hypothetical protein